MRTVREDHVLTIQSNGSIIVARADVLDSGMVDVKEMVTNLTVKQHVKPDV